MPFPLLVLSNGHGEDLIALRVIRALAAQVPGQEVKVLPLVGMGGGFGGAEAEGILQRIGPRQSLPSGGFSNQSLRGLLGDLGAGLPQLSLRQWHWSRHWGRQGWPILAVGDLLPLLLAWASGAPFGFIGTPKSDYTWASAPPAGWGSSTLADRYHRCKGSEWDPWEWALMGSHRCRLVAARDALTARGLRRHRVAALAPGNPMMDGFIPNLPLPAALQGQRLVLLLCGSRMPEALVNFERLLRALAALETPSPTTVLAAMGHEPTAVDLAPRLVGHGFRRGPLPAETGASQAWQRRGLQLLLGPGRFERWAPWAEFGLATAGTATEQLCGLGKPVLSLPGPGPQFKASFARRQSRLLGGAVRPCHSPAELARELQVLLDNPALASEQGRIGPRRMGGPGGSATLATLIGTRLLGAWDQGG